MMTSRPERTLIPLAPPRGNVVAVSAAQLFSHEVAEAKRLGFELQLNTGTQGQVAARLQPRTPSAHAACERATGKTNQAIESSQPVAHPTMQLDCLREAITAVLGMAKDVTA